MSKSIQDIINEQRAMSPIKGLDAKTINLRERSIANTVDPTYGQKISNAVKAAAPKYDGKTTREWAEIHNCTQNKIQEHLRKYGNLDQINDFEIKTIDGKTYEEWANELGVSVTAIHCFYERNGHLDGCGEKNKGNLYQGKTSREWAELLGCGVATINFQLRKYGHLDNVGKKRTEPCRPEKIVYQGKTYKQLELEYGVKSQSIRAHLKLHGHLDNLKKKQ